MELVLHGSPPRTRNILHERDAPLGQKIETVEKRGIVAVWRTSAGRVGYDFRGDKRRLWMLGQGGQA